MPDDDFEAGKPSASVGSALSVSRRDAEVASYALTRPDLMYCVVCVV
jgi:hypothetical protein